MTSWHESWWLALDFESSGIEPLEAFIVTCCAAMMRDDEPRWVREWLLVPPDDTEIPEAATAVHGVTTEHARESGKPRLNELEDIAFNVAKSLQRWLREKAPTDRRDPNAVIDGTWPVRKAVTS